MTPNCPWRTTVPPAAGVMADQDIELLECYLDDALSDDEVRALRGRLASEPALAQAMATLRVARDARQAAWAAMEPDEASVSQLVERVGRSVDRRLSFSRRLHAATRGLAAAAIFVIGLSIGMYLRTPGGGASLNGTVSPSGRVVDAPMIDGGPAGRYIIVDPETGQRYSYATEAEAMRRIEEMRAKRAAVGQR
jgi:hypothetical protein